MADIDWGQTEADLKKAAADRGVSYDKSDLEDIQRNASYKQNAGEDPSKYFNVAIAKYDARANNEPNHPDDNWGTAKTASGTPAQTTYAVNSNGSLTRSASAPTPFTIPRIGATSTPPPAPSTSTTAADRGTTRNPFTGDPLTGSPWGTQADLSPSARAIFEEAQRDPRRQAQLTSALQQIAGAYNTYLGGQGTLDEYLSHLGNGRAIDPQNIQYAIANIAYSDEAKAYAAWKAAHPTTSTTTPPPTTTTTTAPPAPTNPYTSSTRTFIPPPGPANGSGHVANTSPTFDDPSQRLVEDTALERMQQLTNPDPASGTALYESYLKQLADVLKGAPFSDTEMAQLKNSVYQDLLSERDATQQRWLETVSQRGLAPSSGPALEGLKQIDGHFEQLRTQVDSQFALAAIQQRQSNQLQVASIYGSLAGNEEGRLDKAFTYSQVPYGLTNDAFQRNLQLVGAAGSPGGTINSVLGIVNAINQNNQISSQNRTALTTGLLQYLGYLFPNGAGA